MQGESMGFERMVAKMVVFFERHFMGLLAFFALVLLSSVGYYFYDKSSQQAMQLATQDYVEAMDQSDPTLQKQSLLAITKNHPSTDQAAFAHFMLANLARASGEKENMFYHLESALHTARLKSHKMLFTLKLAELYLDFDPEKTLTLLSTTNHRFTGTMKVNADFLKVLASKKIENHELYQKYLIAMEEDIETLDSDKDAESIRLYNRLLISEKGL